MSALTRRASNAREELVLIDRHHQAPRIARRRTSVRASNASTSAVGDVDVSRGANADNAAPGGKSGNPIGRWCVAGPSPGAPDPIGATGTRSLAVGTPVPAAERPVQKIFGAR